MRKVRLLNIVLLVVSVTAFGQKSVKLDVIYLKSDSMLTGKITDSIPGVSITFETLNKQYFFIPLTEIERISHELYTKSHGQLVPLTYANSRHSYWLWLQGGGAVVIHGDRTNQFQADMVNGFRNSNDFGAGLGIGSRFAGNGGTSVLVPMYFLIQTPLMKTNRIPIAAIGAGIVSNPELDWKVGGPFFRADIGFQKPLQSNITFTFTVGFEQICYFSEGLSGQMPTENYTRYSIVTFNAGIML